VDETHAAPFDRAEKRLQMAGQPKHRPNALTLDGGGHEIGSKHYFSSRIANESFND
jgi:hypothetical protein